MLKSKMIVASILVLLAGGLPAAMAGDGPNTTKVLCLDGDHWLLATDAKNIGRQQQWFRAPRPEAKRTKVPWIIQDAFPGYHGVAWYWREFTAPANPHAGGRYLLRFWAVDYAAEVWLDGTRIGEHEGGESPFVLDATAMVKPGAKHLLAVRVLNPTHEPIDGIVLNQTPHRNKALPYGAGSAWNQGGIMDSVELLTVPFLRIDDVFAQPDPRTGIVRVRIQLHNAAAEPAPGRLELAIAPAAEGETVATGGVKQEFPAGITTIETQLAVDGPRPWDLNDPFLYRVTVRAQAEGSDSVDERSVRCGFRDFRLQNGCFRLNGRRIYLRGSHTGNCCPVGLELPHDPDLLRRDLLNVKVMGMNCIRFIAGVARRYQLDLCDEIGLMVYEESYASWCMADSPHMPQRYDESILGMIRRDRNHPSVVIWGLLNETPDGPVFRHAAGLLPAVRRLDDSRMVMLNSGRWDQSDGGVAGIEVWRNTSRVDPCVTYNPTDRTIKALGITWPPGQLALHPGRNNEYGVVRWTAPAAGKYDVSVTFQGIAEKATTDVHVLHNKQRLLDALINLDGCGNAAQFAKTLTIEAGDTIDCAVGFGNGEYGADTTGLAVVIKSAGGKTYHAARDFSAKGNPNGAWSYGQLAAAQTPDPATFTRYPSGLTETRLGSLSNPGSHTWEDVLSDRHPYQRVPHTADVIRNLRTLDGGGLPVFVSEYGVGSAVDLIRVVRRYEQLGKADVEDARFYRVQRDRFLNDWQAWRMDQVFDRPEDFFAQSLAKMAGQRLLGINAIRSNPNVVGYSLTGTVDQGMTGEGLTTTFRELKPGTVDALFDALAPLRWCLFVEPLSVYRGSPVRLEAVLANEDVLLPGEYPLRLEVVGPNSSRVFQRKIVLTIPQRKGTSETPLVLPVFLDDVVIDGPPGKYRFLATFERGASAAGGSAEFYVADPKQMPPVQTEVVLWGEDPDLARWLASRGIRTRPLTPDTAAGREVILACATPPPPDPAAAFADLARRIARGSNVVFLCPEVFRKGDEPTGWLPLEKKGTLQAMRSWVYLKDEWAKPHAIFDGLPAGGLMDLAYYRELIPDHVFSGQAPPAEAVAGAINASQAYSSGLLVAVYELGAGRFILNTLAIRDHLGRHPAAERLLRNMLNYVAREGR